MTNNEQILNSLKTPLIPHHNLLNYSKEEIYLLKEAADEMQDSLTIKLNNKEITEDEFSVKSILLLKSIVTYNELIDLKIMQEIEMITK